MANSLAIILPQKSRTYLKTFTFYLNFYGALSKLELVKLAELGVFKGKVAIMTKTCFTKLAIENQPLKIEYLFLLQWNYK